MSNQFTSANSTLSPVDSAGSSTDRVTRERAVFLNRVIQGMLIIAGLHLVVFLASGGHRTPLDMVGYLGFGAFLGIAMLLLRRGRLLSAGLLICGALYAALTSGAVLWGGLIPGVVTGYLVLILTAGFSMGAAAGAAAAVVVTVTLGSLTVIQVSGLHTPPIMPMPPSAQTTMVGLSLVQAGLMIWYGLRRLEGAIRESEIKEAEARQALAQLRQAQKMEIMGQVSAGIAHDFNNLLSAILGSADLLRMEMKSESHPLVENIIRAGEHGAMLTQQLLAFSRNRPEKAAVYDLRRLITDSGKLLDRLTGDGVRMTLETGDEPVPVRIDRGNLEQVLFNLAVNARDAVQGRGDVRISLENEDGSTALLTMKDNGIGMSPEVVKRIFEPFFTTKKDGRGTGLGLAIVERAVHRAGGTVRVVSSPENGTEFQIRLPLSAERVVEPLRSTRDLPAAVYRARILLLDDNAFLRCAVRSVLEKAGYEVIEGENGRVGLSYLTDAASRIDLVLSDWMMFDVGGAALLQEMRARDIRIPMLLMTGCADTEIDTVAEDFQTKVLRKPIRPFELVCTVNALLTPAEGRGDNRAVLDKPCA